MRRNDREIFDVLRGLALLNRAYRRKSFKTKVLEPPSLIGGHSETLPGQWAARRAKTAAKENLMRISVLKTLLGATMPLLLAAGCAHTPRDEAAMYGPEPTPKLAPTSDVTRTRVYPGNVRPEGIIFPPAAAPAGVAEDEWALGEELRGALTKDLSLAPYPSDVSVIVDKSSKGLVRLRGYVPNDTDRQRLHNRIAEVPGIQKIDDQIVVGLPENIGQTDISDR